jgi:large subunit ribosomal protein L6
LLYYLKMKSKLFIKIPATTKIFISKKQIYILKIISPKGYLYLNLLFLYKKVSNLKKKNLTFTFFRLFQQALVGLNLGFISNLIFRGVGFRVELLDKFFLKLKLGFSHFVFFKIPPQIQIFSPKKTRIIIKSYNKQFLHEFSSRICSFKFPDPYKGKGILVKNQILQLKKGKKK